MAYRSCVTVVLTILAAFSCLLYPSWVAAQAPGLVAAYGFNEGSGTTVTDASGNNNTGTLGSGVTRSTQGKFGSALVFNGSSVVTIPAAASLNLTTAMTLEVWVYPTVAQPTWPAVIVKEQTGNGWVYALYANSDQSRPFMGVYVNGEQTLSGGALLPSNTWSHLATTYDGSTERLYVNGVQVASRAQTGLIRTSTRPVRLGGDTLTGEYFTGRLDEVRIYNRALTQGEIQTDMNTPVSSTPGPNTPPTISSIASQTINEDTATGAIVFTVGDAETAASSLTVSGSSSNTGLVPNGNIVFGGSGANRTVTITPATHQNGTATITVAVSDGQLSASANFLVTVNAVNDAPTITTIANQTTTAGTAVGPINFTVGDVDTPLASLTVSGSSSNPTLVPNGNIVFGGSGANRTVTITPAANQTGTAMITVTVSDGQVSTSTSFQVTVNPSNTNTPPTISAIASQTINEDTATGAIVFTVGDAETAASSLTVSGSSSNTGLVPNGNIVFGGSGANRTVTITPATHQNGTATITVAVSDGQLSASANFLVTVNAVNDAPTITTIANQTTTAGTAVGPINFTVGDVDTPLASLTVSGSSSNPTLVPNGNIVFGGSGANRTVTITPAANQTGTAMITVTVSDGQVSTSTSFQVTVNLTPTSLAAAYDFNESSGTTVTDASGNNNTGTLGSGVTRTTQGKFGSALVFNGSSVVTIPTATSLNLTNGMTLEVWVYPTVAQTTWPAVIVKERTGSGWVYALYANSDQSRPFMGIYINGEQTLAGGTLLPINTWSHLATTYDGSAERLYVNSVQVAFRAQTGSIQTSTLPVRLGGDTLTSEYFTGRLDEVRIYNRALTQGEIQTDMNTPVGSTPPPDTSAPTVSITAPASNATVVSTITVTAAANDDVDVVGVQFFLDGTPLSLEVPDPPYSTLWDTMTTQPGSHTLTARARDAAGNTTTSAAVPVTVRTTTIADIGQWSGVFSWPLVAVHANLLPTGDVLVWDGPSQSGAAFIWRPATNNFTSKNSPDNIFCAGHTLLPDGRLLVVGGHIDNFVGLPDANIFDPPTASWTQVRSMAHGRWYPTAITLPDGRVLVVAGDETGANQVAAIPEIYTVATNTWAQSPSAAYAFPEYPHLFVLSDGRVLATGSFQEAMATQVLNLSSQTWTIVDSAVVDGHSSVMYQLNKFLKSGTSADSLPPYVQAAATSYVLDMTQAQPAWRETAPMVFPRSYHNLTMLPDGSVLATGGVQTTDTFDQTQAVFAAELWAPSTETWMSMASMAVPRLYHSTALLLPDGRVLSAGGGRFGGGPVDDKSNAEIYSPPYLFKGSRPVITSAPSLISYNSSIAITTPDTAGIGSVSLLPLGSVTHHFNANQRYLSLSFTTAGNGLNVQTPVNANIAPSGYYMLFIVDMNGVPSIAAILGLQ